MRRIIQVIATKRSAHHAFVHWYCRNAPRPVSFFNNVLLSSPPRLRELERFDGDAPPVVADAGDHEQELLSGSDDVVMNFEGKSPASIRRWNDGYLRQRVPGELRRVVFLRDPVNTLASLAKRCRPGERRSRFKYFYQVVALERLIVQLDLKPEDLCDRVVLMSPWLRDADYREELTRYFDLRPGAPPTEVMRQGGGSSFGGLAYDPQSDAAALHDRWRAVQDNPLFLAPFAHEPLLAAMRSYFRLFGAYESFDPAELATLRRRALDSRAARAYAKRALEPMRRAGPALDAMEWAPPTRLRRHLWRGYALGRVALGV